MPQVDHSRFRHSHDFVRDFSKSERRTHIVIAITGVMMVVEITAGLLSHSMALLADGWHMSTHVTAFLIAAVAYYFTRRHASDRQFSFGTGKIGVLGGFASAVVLSVVAFLMAGESGGTAKILDFGLAKFRSNATQQQTVDTAPGAVLGTLRYMSPEQRSGEDPQPSWDLWALAVVAYEILTGAYPSNDGSHGDWLGPRAVAGFTPIATNLAEAPPSWQEFFNRAFAHETAQRPQSAETFFSEFQRAVS